MILYKLMDCAGVGFMNLTIINHCTGFTMKDQYEITALAPGNLSIPSSSSATLSMSAHSILFLCSSHPKSYTLLISPFA